jgi:hypothetical protein
MWLDLDHLCGVLLLNPGEKTCNMLPKNNNCTTRSKRIRVFSKGKYETTSLEVIEKLVLIEKVIEVIHVIIH